MLSCEYSTEYLVIYWLLVHSSLLPCITTPKIDVGVSKSNIAYWSVLLVPALHDRKELIIDRACPVPIESLSHTLEYERFSSGKFIISKLPLYLNTRLIHGPPKVSHEPVAGPNPLYIASLSPNQHSSPF